LVPCASRVCRLVLSVLSATSKVPCARSPSLITNRLVLCARRHSNNCTVCLSPRGLGTLCLLEASYGTLCQTTSSISVLCACHQGGWVLRAYLECCIWYFVPCSSHNKLIIAQCAGHQGRYSVHVRVLVGYRLTGLVWRVPLLSVK
jgi:hypothetical protein